MSITFRIIILLFFIIFFFIVFKQANALETSDNGTQKTWSLEPEIHSGIVYDYAQYVPSYYGAGISAFWRPESWAIEISCDAEKYKSVYFGVTQDTLQELLINGTLNRPLFDKVKIDEWKWDHELLAGRGFWSNNLYFLLGIRQVFLNNNFSSMNIFGPSGKTDINFYFSRNTSFCITSKGVYGKYLKIKNQRDNFVLFDEKKSISYTGELRGIIDWSVLFVLHLNKINFKIGYEGAVTYFKYINRYSHGMTLKFEF